MEFREKLEEYVGDQIKGYAKYNEISLVDVSHVISIGVSILETKFPDIGPGYGGGGFVDAILSNDLEATFARADSTNRKYVLFYLQLLNSFSPYHIEGYTEISDQKVQ